LHEAGREKKEFKVNINIKVKSLIYNHTSSYYKYLYLDNLDKLKMDFPVILVDLD